MPDEQTQPLVPAATPASDALPAAAPAPVTTDAQIEDVTKEMTEELQEMLSGSESVNVLAPEVLPVATSAQVTAPAVSGEAPAPISDSVPAPVSAPVPVVNQPVVSEPAAMTATPTEAMVPPVPVAAPTPISDEAHHQVMGQILGAAIETGKHQVPAAPGPLVCRPQQLESWRVFKIMSEFVEGFELIGKYGLAASFFGTARTGFDDHFYKDATALAGLLAKAGYAVITGGSAGIMEAANKGAYEAGGASVGLNIELDDSQGLNEYLTDSMTFHHFFARKVMLAYASDVYIYFPGGYGTLDEFTELVTLVQTKKIKRIPIVLYGKEYWTPLVEFFTNKLNAEYHAISPEDLELFTLVDTVDEAFSYIQKNVTSC